MFLRSPVLFVLLKACLEVCFIIHWIFIFLLFSSYGGPGLLFSSYLACIDSVPFEAKWRTNHLWIGSAASCHLFVLLLMDFLNIKFSTHFYLEELNRVQWNTSIDFDVHREPERKSKDITLWHFKKLSHSYSFIWMFPDGVKNVPLNWCSVSRKRCRNGASTHTVQARPAHLWAGPTLIQQPFFITCHACTISRCGVIIPIPTVFPKPLLAALHHIEVRA